MFTKPIERVEDFVKRVEKTWEGWGKPHSVWFRGESHRASKAKPSLRPKVFGFGIEQENLLVQSFRRKAGGMSDTPPFERTDLWLFLAQHHNVPTRLLDWSEGALSALFFAINDVEKPNPIVYMLNPRVLKTRACAELLSLREKQEDRFAQVMGIGKDDEKYGKKLKYAFESIRRLSKSKRNFPLTYKGGDLPAMGYVNIAPAWEERGQYSKRTGIIMPIPVPGTYQGARMIAQRSCFTVHGRERKKGLKEILEYHMIGDVAECLVEISIAKNKAAKKRMLAQLARLGITNASIFPDLDRLGYDLTAEAKQ